MKIQSLLTTNGENKKRRSRMNLLW